MKPTNTQTGDRSAPLPVIEGYAVTQLLYAQGRTLVYRGRRQADGYPVVLKLLQSDRPSIHDLLRLRNHYTIAKNLNLPGIVQPLSLEPYGNSFVLVMPDDESLPLSDYTATQPLNVPEVLAIAIQLSDILHDLHQHRVIHKDIKPSNILIHPHSKQVKLTDFSIASLLPKETEEIKHPNVLEGTLAYVSPEQTGRMNRGIDYRTDFYALGVTLFELLTGKLPFPSTDPLELVHCHIAVQPPLAHECDLTIPPILSEIIAKLMAKNSEDRYQNALGLKYDLERCQTLYQTQGVKAWFTLAEHDVCDRFLIPERLYGRDAEVMELLSAFNRVSGGTTELLLVAGFSGIGKTAVVNEVHKPIVRQRGYFIKGKFDQFNRSRPLIGFVQAFRDLMGQLLSESDAQLQNWKAQILAALGGNGQVIIDVIPELAQIIGTQPPAVELSGTAAQNRFNVLFQKFIQVFTTPEHPLVMFLDDLQWADAASLNLMQLLMAESEAGHLLVIGAYRDNEVSSVHPLMMTLDTVQQTGATVNTITLPPLSQGSLNQLVADTLNCSESLAQPLTDLVYQKTRGNPFFATQFLKALHHDGLIEFIPPQSPLARGGRGGWQCDIARVWAAALTDDVVEFMALQLQKLPAATQDVLKLAACIGNQFDLNTLALVRGAYAVNTRDIHSVTRSEVTDHPGLEQSEHETATALWMALQQGLILPNSQIYKFFQDGSTVAGRASDAGRSLPSDGWGLAAGACTYRFLHDRVQQAAYSLIPKDQTAATHLNIGRLLLKQWSRAERDEKIFEIVNQLNYGSRLLETQAERDELAQLNQLAGSKAKAATAYTAAYGYFTTGLQLLDHESWQQHYGLTLTLHESAAEAAYLSGQLDQVEPLVHTVLERAKTAAEKAPAYQVQILTASASAQLFRGVQIGLQALADLGIDLPEVVQPHDVGHALQAIATQLDRRSPDELLTLPRMTDAAMLAAMRLLSDINNLAYQSAPQLLPLIILKQVELSLHHGNSPDSALAYAGYGFILLNFIGEIEAGYAFGQLALNLVDQLDASAIRGKVGFLTTVWFTHWVKHANTGLLPSLHYCQAALLSGDLEFAALLLFLHSYTSYHLGRELTTLQREMAQHHQAILSLKQEGSLRLHTFHEQLVANLQAPSLDVQTISGEYYDEQQQLAIHLSRNERSLLCHLYGNKLMLCYWFGDYALAADNATQTAAYLDGLPSNLVIVLFYWYAALTWLALYPQASQEQQTQWLDQVTLHQQKLQVWAAHAPMNFLHKWHLVEAERCRVLHQYVEAMDHYDRAIALANEHQYIHEAALANERAAQFYLDWGKETIAQTYLTHAYYGYARWGAIAKVNHLAQHYSHLLSSLLNQPNASSITPRDTLSLSATVSHPSTSLDLRTIVQANQTLSSEIQLEHLLPTLIQLVITNAGADKAALFLNHNGSLELAIKYFDHAVQSIERKPVDACKYVPLALIHYVERTLETVITDCKAHVSTVSDVYCVQHQPKSMLCTPIVYQGRLVAVLYLENAITSGAFTDERVELLKLLCAQAAIALENARLYQQAQSYAQQLERSLDALRSSQARFQKVSDNIPGVIYQLQTNPADGSCRVTYMSSGCADLYEVPAEAMLSGDHPLSRFEHPDDHAGIEQKRHYAEQHLTPFQHECRIVTPSGQVKWVQVAAQPERQADGVIVWDGVMMDISDRKQAEAERETLLHKLAHLNQELEQANQQLADYSQTLEQKVEARTAELKAAQERIIAQEKLASLGTLTAGVAHELRNPLNFVTNYAEGSVDLSQDLLEALQPILPSLDPDTAAAIASLIADLQENATTIRRQGQRAAQIIANMMQHTHANYEQATPQPTHLHELLDQALKLAYHSKRAQNSDFSLSIQTDYAPHLEPVNVIPGNLMRAFINLIDNACDAMLSKQHQLHAHSPQVAAAYIPTLSIATRDLGNQVEIRIRDSGCGIDPAIQPQILDPFFTTKSPGDGTGLGLSITHDIVVKQHQGSLIIETAWGDFTEIVLTLPH